MHSSGRSSTSRVGLGRGDVAAISFGGVAGASLRFLVTGSRETIEGGWFNSAPNPELAIAIEAGIPNRTLVVNLVGCLLLGALTVMLSRPTPPIPRRVLVGLSTGFCGSLTTFSSFAVEAAELLGARSEANPSVGLSYIGISLLGGAFTFWLGRVAAQRSVLAPGARTLR